MRHSYPWVLFLTWLVAHGARRSEAHECFPARNGNARLRNAVTTYIQNVQVLRSATNRKNHPLSIKYGYPIGVWCTSNVTNFNYVFANKSSFNEPLRLWNTSSATSMVGMFDGALKFDQSLSNFDTKQVTAADRMFRNCRSFWGQGLGSWDTSRLVSASSMFENAIKFDGAIASWTTSQLQRADGMFRGSQRFNQSLQNWDVSRLQDATGMFFGASTYNQNLCAWGAVLSNATSVGDMFRSTSCATISDPRFTAVRIGPFCAECPSSRPKLPSAVEGPIPMPVIPVAMANLPDGRILTWSADYPYKSVPLRFKNNASLPQGTCTSTYDPATGNATQLRVVDTHQRIFCPGVSTLNDGRILISGGEDENGTTIYDPWSDTWIMGPQMSVARGYNSQITLSDGKAFTLGGSWSGPVGGKYGELYDPVLNVWEPKIGTVPSGDMLANDTITVKRVDSYFSMFEAVNGKILHAGPAKRMHWIDLQGNGSITPSVYRGDDTDAIFGEIVMYDIDKLFAVGGAESREVFRIASPRAYTIDMSSPDTRDPIVERLPDMAWGRINFNVVVLPNGMIVVIGGQTNPLEWSDEFSILVIEMFDPATKTWVEFDTALTTPRNYHSASILLVDGRIASGGGGLATNGTESTPSNHLNLEILTPPYLVQSNGTLAVRPIVVDAPDEFELGDVLSITMDTNSSSHSFVLMKLASATHSTNLGQRRVPLTVVAQDGANFSVSVPSHPVHVPSGLYWLFALNGAGVPSVGRTLLRKST